jgi:hypothetical protein
MRRGFRRAFRRSLVPDAPPALQRAHELLSIGDFDAAAVAFEQLANGAEGRDGPRAPMLFLQAGRTRLLAGQIAHGMTLLMHGLGLLAARGQWRELQRAGQRITMELEQRGLTAEASEIATYLRANLPADFTPPTDQVPARKLPLPTHCPSCGGAVRPDEIEWLDEVTAECDYCGSPLRSEG